MRKERILLTIVLAIFLIATSCEFFYPDTNDNKTVHIITMGFAYPMLKEENVLANTLRDQHGITGQLVALAESCGYGYEVLEFNDGQYGNGWTYPAKGLEKNIVWGKTRYRHYTGDTPAEAAYTTIAKTGGRTIAEMVATIINDTIEVCKDDILIFHYSGHGNEHGLLIPDQDGSGYEVLSPGMLLAALDSLDCRQMLILDCCYSGIFLEDGDLESTLAYRPSGETDRQTMGNPFNTIGEAFANGFGKSGGASPPSRFIISAASDRQESWDDDRLAAHEYAPYYGAFTIWVLDYLGYDFENLSGTYRMDDGILTAAELYNHAYSHLRDATRITATPNITASRYDLVLFEL